MNKCKNLLDLQQSSLGEFAIDQSEQQNKVQKHESTAHL